MKKIYSKVDSEILLHIVHKFEDFEEGRTELVDGNQFIQCAALQMDYGKTFRPHKHIFKAGEPTCIAQESWVIIRGTVEVYFYDVDGTLLETELLSVGDCSITLQGGHTYKIMKGGTKVLEYKTGPYKGQELDKVFIDDKD